MSSNHWILARFIVSLTYLLLWSSIWIQSESSWLLHNIHTTIAPISESCHTSYYCSSCVWVKTINDFCSPTVCIAPYSTTIASQWARKLPSKSSLNCLSLLTKLCGLFSHRIRPSSSVHNEAQCLLPVLFWASLSHPNQQLEGASHTQHFLFLQPIASGRNIIFC